jgi:hypothetical protein
MGLWQAKDARSTKQLQAVTTKLADRRTYMYELTVLRRSCARGWKQTRQKISRPRLPKTIAANKPRRENKWERVSQFSAYQNVSFLQLFWFDITTAMYPRATGLSTARLTAIYWERPTKQLQATTTTTSCPIGERMYVRAYRFTA